MGNTGFKFESRIFYFIHLQNEENFMKEKNQVVPDHIRPKIYPYPPKKKFSMLQITHTHAHFISIHT